MSLASLSLLAAIVAGPSPGATPRTASSPVATPCAGPSPVPTPDAATLDDVARGRRIEREAEDRHRAFLKRFEPPGMPIEALMSMWLRMDASHHDANLFPIAAGAPDFTPSAVAAFGHATIVPMHGPISGLFEAPTRDVYFIVDARGGFSAARDRDARLYRMRDDIVSEIPLPFRSSAIAVIAQNDERATLSIERMVDQLTTKERAVDTFAWIDAGGFHFGKPRTGSLPTSAHLEPCEIHLPGTAHPSFVNDAQTTLVSAQTLLDVTHGDVDFSLVYGGCRRTGSALLFWINDYFSGVTYVQQDTAMPTLLFAGGPARTSRDFLIFESRSGNDYTYDFLKTAVPEGGISSGSAAPSASSPP